MKPKILIVGAGFAGAFCAKKLSELIGDAAEINLVSKSPHFELHANFYKVVSDGSPVQACVPLDTIFNHTSVNCVNDAINTVSFKHNLAIGASGDRYHYDYLVLALGSENSYFGIPGVSNFSHSLRTIQEAVRLSRHIHDTLQEKAENKDQGLTEFTIVGGGPTGVELAGELSIHLNMLAQEYELDRSKIKVELIEATNAILPMLTTPEAAKVQSRLQAIGVEVKTNSKVEKEIETGLIINGTEMKTKSVIWTAGVKAHHLYEEWGLQIGKGGKVVVADTLQSSEYSNVFIAGDGAQVPGSGLAWPSVDMGMLAATNIKRSLDHQILEKYQQKIYPLFLPVGQNWAMAKFTNVTLWGSLGYAVRDLHIFQLLTTLVSFSQAWSILQSEKELCSVCDTYTHKLDQIQLA